MKIRRLSLVAMLALTPAVQAAGQHRQYNLDWPRAGEVLTYQSCGCADSCWTAELRKGKKLKARLRCDCEKLYFAKERGREEQVADNCDAFNAVDKMDQITQRMKELEGK
ncbi:hypothetical protein ASE26_12295 [Duganella sp. Root198D2]|nr:hypothetical protein ASE26_12295 [Duganella sp. Root198D2]